MSACTCSMPTFRWDANLCSTCNGDIKERLVPIVERETVAAIVAAVRAQARTIGASDLNKLGANDDSIETVANWIESGAWKRGKERGDG